MTLATDSKTAPAEAVEPVRAAPAESPFRRAIGKLVADRTAMGALAVLILVVVASLAAPLYAKYVSGTDPFRSSLSAKITIDGKKVPVMERSTEGLGLGVTPIGPTWGPRYLLGADSQGRDVAARLLYGGRNSLMIAGTATAICLFLAALVGVTAGFFGGVVDMVLSRLLDVLWAFPVYLLAISLSIVLIAQGLTIGPSRSSRTACCCRSSSSA